MGQPATHSKDKLDGRFEDSIKDPSTTTRFMEGDVTLLLAFDLWASGNSITSGPRDGKSIWPKFNIGGTRVQILQEPNAYLHSYERECNYSLIIIN